MTLTELEKREDESLSRSPVTREPTRPTVRPLVDVFENDEEILLVADLPGVPAGNLKVRLEDGELTLEGRWHDTEDRKTLATEYVPVDYRRTFVVPDGIDPESVKARAKDGVVTIHLPKAEAFRPREIPVHAG
ncbi:MAG: Hsp20/alpha crystallin family protein [Deltaproteobacteria bacterium]|nr:Hsp20/alpha crystallin family protein [Deltaproteobacteria bacterium]